MMMMMMMMVMMLDGETGKREWKEIEDAANRPTRGASLSSCVYV